MPCPADTCSHMYTRIQTRRASISRILNNCMDFAALVERVAVDPLARIDNERGQMASIGNVRAHREEHPRQAAGCR